MEQFLRRTWAEIDLEKIEKNYDICRSMLRDGVMMMGVIKADGYGHGAVAYAKIFSRKGCEWFAVSNLDEALQIREAGIDTPILILGITPVEMANVLAYNNIAQAVFNLEYAKALSERACEQGVQINIHIKVDTGMSRIGFLYQDSEDDAASIDEMAQACRLPGLYAQGIFQHFAVADCGDAGEVYTRLQYDLFLDAIKRLEAKGITFEICHCCNSAGASEYRDLQMSMARLGIVIYGLKSSDKVAEQWGIEPVMQVKSVVAMVKEIEAGTTVSYGRTFTAQKDMKIATIPIGYADGYTRRLSGNGGRMIIGGKYVPIIGTICMDMCMVDVTGLDVKAGDLVTVIGKDGDKEITANEIAAKTGTINYEITCDISKRVPRVYMRGGDIVSVQKF
ncbi:MAG: alanine racemase [Clostridia bacterium]|nr:alanine racemase [Clostridia bacterium]